MSNKVRYVVLPIIIVIIFAIVLLLNRADFTSNTNKERKASNTSRYSSGEVLLERPKGFFSGELINEATDKIIINENTVETMVETSLRADLMPKQLEVFPDELKFMGAVKVPENYDMKYYYSVYTRSDLDTDIYDQLHDYVFYYENSGDKARNESGDIISTKNRNILVSMSKLETPMRNYYAQGSDSFVLSQIGYLPVEIQKYYYMYIAKFKINDTFFDIETLGVSIDELVDVIISLNNSLYMFSK